MDLKAQWLLQGWPAGRWRGHRLLVAVSGGADSVALLLALSELVPARQLVVGHFNHHWRGRHSQSDQQFVIKLAARLSLSCVTNATEPIVDSGNQNDSGCDREFAMLASECGSGLFKASESKKSEESARHVRYEFLKSAAYRHGAGYVVTAHTADDRVETMLHNVMRGTGLAGVAAIAEHRSLDEHLTLVRPMLQRSRQDVLAFLADRHQVFCTDASNNDIAYSRNFIRHRLLPQILERYPGAMQNLRGLADLAEETTVDLQQLAQRWLDQVDQRMTQLRSSEAFRQRIAAWPHADWFVLPIALASDQVWSVLQVALRQVWLERGWPQADMSKLHWHAVRDAINGSQNQPGALPSSVDSATRSPKSLLNLPGGISLQIHKDMLAIGRCSPQAQHPLS